MYTMPPMQDMGMGMGGMPMPMPILQPQHQPPPKRQPKILDIIDPKTGKSIELGRNASSTRSSDDSTTTAAASTSTSTTAQSTPQKKESTPVKKLPAAETSQVVAKQNEAVESVSVLPKSPKKKIVTPTVADSAKESTPAAAKAIQQTVDKKLETNKSGSSATTTTSTTTTTTNTSLPKPTTQISMEQSAKVSSADKQSETNSSEKKSRDQDVASPALQQKAPVVEKEDKVPADVHAIEKKTDVSFTLERKTDGKLIYTLELLMRYDFLAQTNLLLVLFTLSLTCALLLM